MRVFVTGANGFLGRHVVRALVSRGHDVRALVRPAADDGGIADSGRVEVVRADLRAAPALHADLDGMDALIHLAAAVGGDEDAQFAATVGGTERLMSAMAAARVPRLVLASSFAVYDWGRIRDRITEDSPLVAEARELDRRGGYTVAKVWQERVARRAADEHGMGLTVLRPGFVWAAGHEPFAGVGPAVRGVQVVVGPTRPLPVTYAENCADCFVHAVEQAGAIGQTLNVIDDAGVSAWRFMREYGRRVPEAGRPVPVPYEAARAGAELAQQVSRRAFGEGGRLPSILTPAHFEARFKPLRFSVERVRSVLGWQPPWTLEAAMDRAYGPPGSAPSLLP